MLHRFPLSYPEGSGFCVSCAPSSQMLQNLANVCVDICRWDPLGAAHNVCVSGGKAG